MIIRTKPSDKLGRALHANSAAEMRAALFPRDFSLKFSHVVQLTRRLLALGGAAIPIRIGIVHTYTSEPLDAYLQFEACLQGLAADVYHAPYGVTVQETEDNSNLRAHRPDLTLLLLQWQDLDPALVGPISAFTCEARREVAVRARDAIVRMAAMFRNAIGGHLIITLLPGMTGPGLGTHDASARNSESVWRAGVKADVASQLGAELASVTLLELDEIVADIGRQRFFDRRWWYTARFPFSPEAAQELARRIVALAAVIKLPRAKVLVLDADNTLWGGIIGEDGINGIALGHEYPGNVFVSFQRRLLEYQQRGLLLALCSKNNAADVLEVLRQHPHQVLREEHFAAIRVNWEPKESNIRALADELNLGIDSFVFVDDSDHECLAIRQGLPTVEVIQMPSRAVDIPTCLDTVARLEVLSITAEDRRRTEMYVQERKRRQLADHASDVAGFLRSLDMRMVLRVDDPGQVARVAQLTQKTNQFNLTTRRYTESDIRDFIGSPEWLVAHFSLTDVFGDSGLVGVMLVRLGSSRIAEIDSLLMSCRVIGRKAESAFLENVLALLRARGVQSVLADYVPTDKNQLVQDFLPQHGFSRCDDGRYTRDLSLPAPAALADLPIAVQIDQEEDRQEVIHERI